MTEYFYLLIQRERERAQASGPFSSRDHAEQAAIAALTAGAERVEILDSSGAEEVRRKMSGWEGDTLLRMLRANPTDQRSAVETAARRGDPVARLALADMQAGD
jgi:hypothetical protein